MGNRIKNSSRNVVFGAINKIVSMFLPFVTRTVVIYLLGAEYLGINSLFASLLSFLSLTELGLGTAIVNTMYKPIAEHDEEAICNLLSYYRRFYRIIGSVILTLGTIIVPLVPYLIKGSAPGNVNVYILYYLYLLKTVVSYFWAGYKQSLLIAHQRSDIRSNIYTVSLVVVQLVQIAALYLTKDFYVYAIVPIVGTIITNLLNARVANKLYPKYQCRGNIDQETKQQISKKMRGLIGNKINTIVIHSSDTLVISAFLGLTVTAIYGNYYSIMSAVFGFILLFYSSMTASIGNSLITESMEKNYKLYKILNLINAWAVGFCAACFLCLYQPFMEIWVGKELMYDFGVVIALVAYFIIYQIQRTIFTYKDAAGIWYEDRYRCYIMMLVNIVSNVILVQVIGIYGIIVSSILAFAISLPWANTVLFKNLFHMPSLKNLLQLVVYILVACAIAVITYLVCLICGDGLLGLLERAGICLVVPNILLYLAYHRTKPFQQAKEMVLGIVKRKLKRK